MGEALHDYPLTGILPPPPLGMAGSWFAVQTKPRHEKRAAMELKEKGVEVFLPLLTAIHHWSDRRRQVEVPLFGGYLFVRIQDDAAQRVTVLRTQGALRFVGMRGTGVEVPEEDIQAIQTLLQERVAFTACPFVNIGQKVRIRGGSLDGLRGILTAVNDDRSLIVSVESIQRSLQFRIDGYNLEPA
ncbi:MAG TPA: UpxY family transcription antiterminator [Terriglobales bacterium]|jgi:transcription antitermination factor NusG|nr:UpxY family transcription antiterminator [Terriglobales bacterium]